MKKILFLIYTITSLQFCIAQADSITDKQLISIFTNLPLNEKKETWKAIIEKQTEKYIDTPLIDNISLFLIKDLSFYHFFSSKIYRGYIKVSGSPITNTEKTLFDTSSVLDIYLYLKPGTTKKEAKAIYTKFIRIAERSFIHENNHKPKGDGVRLYTYSNHKIDRFKPLLIALTKVKENGYIINLHYQKMHNGSFFVRKNLL